jgi:hypothetical protein
MNAAMIVKEPHGVVRIGIGIALIEEAAIRPSYLNPTF